MTELKEGLKELEVKTHNLSKRMYEVEKNEAVLTSEFTHLRENSHDKFQLFLDTMRDLNQRDDEQMKEFLQFKQDVEKQLTEKRVISNFMFSLLRLWPLWLVVFLFLVFLDMHKFAAHLLNFM